MTRIVVSPVHPSGRVVSLAARAGCGILVLGMSLVGCGRDAAPGSLVYAPDMAASVPYDAQSPNPVTRDGKTAMLPAPGTVPRGVDVFLYGPTEAPKAGRELKNPLPASPEVLARGKVVYDRICATCHGLSGKGDGPIVPPFSKPPSLLDDAARQMKDGQIVHIIVRGRNLMPPHAAQVAPEDRWQVVHYVRSLQEGGSK